MSPTLHSVVGEDDSPRAPEPAREWAAEMLRAALAERVPAMPIQVRLCRTGRPGHRQAIELAQAPAELPPESFVLARMSADAADPDTETVLLAAAGDDRGMVYALLELRDLVLTAADPQAALRDLETRFEHPRLGVRSMSRLFTSHRLDLSWFHDRSFWDDYLTDLATHRFNRFSLAFGLGYDYLIDKRVADNYLCFPYPFVLDVPGYDVRVDGLDADERGRNLATLQYVAAAAARRGLEFSLGLWNHAYRLDPVTPTERWLVSGLDETNHADYCADALAMLLAEIPQVNALTFRVHFEGGVPEPTHAFWRRVMTGIGRVDRTIALDAHAKGINDELLDALRSVGSPLTLSTKYWGEHMGLPYHQAGIREKEFSGHLRQRSRTGEAGGGSGADVTRRRSFTRYGYADYARADADYGLLHRIWPGTQRVLMQGDPAMAAGIGRQAGFAGSVGVEWFDALTFWGKKDSAEHPLTGDDHVPTDLYRDGDLRLTEPDLWRKYRLQLRLHGRLSYDPDAPATSWRRAYQHVFGAAAAHAEAALAHASRILPLITTAHAPSVAGNIYWPEMDTPIPLLEPAPVTENPFADHGWHLNADFDMLAPYTFGNTSPLDPQLFANADAYADSLLSDEPTAKYSPLEVAEWLEGLAATTVEHLAALAEHDTPQVRRLAMDCAIAAHLGQFFGRKSRAAVAWRLHTRTGSPGWLERCRTDYGMAREAWAAAAEAARGYVEDIPFGQMPYQRGHWRDRLPAIDADLAAVDAHVAACECQRTGQVPASRSRLDDQVEHQVPDRYEVGCPLTISVQIADPTATVRLHHRAVDQSSRWGCSELTGPDHERHGTVPAELTTGAYPVQYYFELRRETSRGGGSALRPGLDPYTLSDQPYHVVHADPSIRWGRPNA